MKSFHKFEQSSCRFGPDRRMTLMNTLYETNTVVAPPILIVPEICSNVLNFMIQNPEYIDPPILEEHEPIVKEVAEPVIEEPEPIIEPEPEVEAEKEPEPELKYEPDSEQETETEPEPEPVIETVIEPIVEPTPPEPSVEPQAETIDDILDSIHNTEIQDIVKRKLTSLYGSLKINRK